MQEKIQIQEKNPLYRIFYTILYTGENTNTGEKNSVPNFEIFVNRKHIL